LMPTDCITSSSSSLSELLWDMVVVLSWVTELFCSVLWLYKFSANVWEGVPAFLIQRHRIRLNVLFLL
jgi:hypothetical protein